MNRTMVNIVRTLLIEVQLPHKFGLKCSVLLLMSETISAVGLSGGNSQRNFRWMQTVGGILQNFRLCGVYVGALAHERESRTLRPTNSFHELLRRP